MERRKAHPSVEIELVDESSGEEVRDACPESFDSPQCNEDKQGEPTLYKRVIYVPSNANSRAEVVQNRQPKYIASLKYCFHNGYSHDEEDDDDRNTIPADPRRRCSDEDIPCDRGSVVTDHRAVTAEETKMDRSGSGANVFASYWKQWADGFHPKVALSAIFVLVMHFVWILAVGSWLGSKTRDKIGTAEVFLSTFLSGALFAVVGSQPVLIVGVSVPALVFVSAVFTAADRLSLKFLPWMGWIAIWSAVLLAVMASVKSWAMSLAGQITQFSWEVVQIFVGLTLVWHGIEETIQFFSGDSSDNSALLSLWLVTCIFLLGILIDGTRQSHFLSGRSRQIVADFGPAFLVLAVTALPGIPKLAKIKLSRVQMPSCGYHSDDFTKLGALVRLKAVPLWAIFLAFIPGALLAALILIDHESTSTLLTSDSEGLRKQKHLSRRRDLLVLSGILFLCGLLGLPLCYGLFPQSIRHIHGLASKLAISSSDLESQDIFIHRHSRGKIRVQRVSSLFVSLIIGIPLLPRVALLVKKVPQPLLLGYCLQMGLLGFKSLRFTEYLRIALFERSPSEGPSLVAVRLYIITQIGCVATVFVVSCTQAALIFPLFMLTAVWLRHYVMGKVFQKPEFETLDRKLFPGRYDSSPDPSSVNPSEQQVHSWLQSNSVPAQAQETSGSSFSHYSITLPSEVKTRRLKERSLRKKKRKRHPSFEADGHMASVSISGEETTKSRHRKEQGSWGSLSSSLRFLMGLKDNPSSLPSNDNNNRGLPRFPKRARNKAVCLSLKGGDPDVDVHSNILYDPYWGDAIVVSSENAMFDESKGEKQNDADSKQIIIQQQDRQLVSLDKREQILSLMGPPTPPPPSECINGSKARQQKKQKQKQQQDELLSEYDRPEDETLVISRGLRRTTMSFDEWANASDSLPVGTMAFSSVMASTSASASGSGSSSGSSSSSFAPVSVAGHSIHVGPVLPCAAIVPALSRANNDGLC